VRSALQTSDTLISAEEIAYPTDANFIRHPLVMRANEAESGMPRNGKDDPGQAGDSGAIGERVDNHQTLGEALSQAEFKPAKVGRKVISQGRNREKLKKWAPEDPD
jgi:hypothetical protein